MHGRSDEYIPHRMTIVRRPHNGCLQAREATSGGCHDRGIVLPEETFICRTEDHVDVAVDVLGSGADVLTSRAEVGEGLPMQCMHLGEVFLITRRPVNVRLQVVVLLQMHIGLHKMLGMEDPFAHAVGVEHEVEVEPVDLVEPVDVRVLLPPSANPQSAGMK